MKIILNRSKNRKFDIIINLFILKIRFKIFIAKLLQKKILI
jgi:hypothetical protein